jgi:hypothetical protein
LYLRQLGDYLRIKSGEESEVPDLEEFITKFSSILTLTNAHGGPVGDEDHESENNSSDDTEDDKMSSEDENGDDKSEGQDYRDLKVTVRHTSITDFFNSDDQDEDSPIRVNPLTAEVEIVKTCLLVFSDEAIYEFCDEDDGLANYATLLFDHLRLIDMSKISKEDKLQVTGQLTTFLRDPLIIGRWVTSAFYNIHDDFLGEGPFMEAVPRWYEDPDVQEYCKRDPGTSSWVELVKSSPFEELIRPFAMECARRWLQDTEPIEYDDEPRFLEKYLAKVASLKNVQEQVINSSS